MGLICQFQRYTLTFKFDAGTSRGVLKERAIWIIKISDENKPEIYGLGEVGPLAGLSHDEGVDYQDILQTVTDQLRKTTLPVTEEKCLELAGAYAESQHPALRFGLEMALLDLWNGGRRLLYPSEFTAGKKKIPINGLIWMGEEAFMWDQANRKKEEGYSCIKMKIGAIDFNKELKILEGIRGLGVEILRTDANGAFSPDNALSYLKKLAPLRLHSIEQPIRAGQWKEMAELCRKSPVPLALDEELIGVYGEKREELLKAIKPQYIILKPMLLGGIQATREWIRLAEDHQIGWWITSALESNIGLNAICQMTALLHYEGHQGLGTGQLYENNFDSPLVTHGGYISYDPTRTWTFKYLEL
jgi:o-succinylbenzoate synthase